MKIVLSSVIIILLLHSITVFAKTYVYIDGNNNSYTLTTKTLKYTPISASNSSSGFYSGGNPKSVTVSKTIHKEITSLFEKIMADKTSTTVERLMGSSTLILGKKSVYVKSSNKLLLSLETKLKTALGMNARY